MVEAKFTSRLGINTNVLCGSIMCTYILNTCLTLKSLRVLTQLISTELRWKAICISLMYMFINILNTSCFPSDNARGSGDQVCTVEYTHKDFPTPTIQLHFPSSALYYNNWTFYTINIFSKLLSYHTLYLENLGRMGPSLENVQTI